MVRLNNLAAAVVIFLSFATTYALTEITQHIEFASKDYGNMVHNVPLKVVNPASVADISLVIGRIYEEGLARCKTVKIAARGNGHSIQGQAQTNQGVVINMRSLPGPMSINTMANPPYIDVAGGELWINVLTESLKHGLSPVSWTDYLYLTVGGTLSNGGISGQVLGYGPQISNVLQLEIVTGKGEVKTVSEKQDSELFFGALGGLGQFGIITKARIVLAPAPTRVKRIKALYLDFTSMSKDQESLIAKPEEVDYVEGFVTIDQNSNGKTQYSLEVVKYYSPSDAGSINQKVSQLLSGLSYIRPSLNISDLAYLEFLDRVHTTELELRKLGLWEITHPWLNLMIPKASIERFVQDVFGNIITESVNGPIIIYPINKSKWKESSIVTPDEDIFYLLGILSAAAPSNVGEINRLVAMNKRLLDFCQQANLGVKEYLPHYTTQAEWIAHYGGKWLDFVKTKRMFDPLALLSPGQQIFPNGIPLCDYNVTYSNEKWHNEQIWWGVDS